MIQKYLFHGEASWTATYGDRKTKRSHLGRETAIILSVKPTGTEGMLLEWRLRTLRHNIISIADARVELEDHQPGSHRREQLEQQIEQLRGQEPELMAAINQLSSATASH